MDLKVLNDQVLVSRADVTVIGAAEIALVKKMAQESGAGRARICAHPDAGNPLHEMLIALSGRRYIRPHAHRDKSESFHMIEGALSIVLFDTRGAITRIVDMTAGEHGAFFYRLAVPTFHTVILQTDIAVFHETTNGPFNPADTLFPEWAPDGTDPVAADAFLRRLLNEIDAFRRAH